MEAAKTSRAKDCQGLAMARAMLAGRPAIEVGNAQRAKQGTTAGRPNGRAVVAVAVEHEDLGSSNGEVDADAETSSAGGSALRVLVTAAFGLARESSGASV